MSHGTHRNSLHGSVGVVGDVHSVGRIPLSKVLVRGLSGVSAAGAECGMRHLSAISSLHLAKISNCKKNLSVYLAYGLRHAPPVAEPPWVPGAEHEVPVGEEDGVVGVVEARVCAHVGQGVHARRLQVVLIEDEYGAVQLGMDAWAGRSVDSIRFILINQFIQSIDQF